MATSTELKLLTWDEELNVYETLNYPRWPGEILVSIIHRLEKIIYKTLGPGPDENASLGTRACVMRGRLAQHIYEIAMYTDYSFETITDREKEALLRRFLRERVNGCICDG